MMIVLVISCFLAAVLLDKFPRRSLVMSLGIGSVISLAVFVITASLVEWVEWFKYGALLGLFGYILCYGYVF